MGLRPEGCPLERALGLGEEPGRKVRPGGRGQAEFRADPGWGGGAVDQDRILGASHIEAEILLFFKKIVEDEFAHEVWVQCVVNHLRSSELGGGTEDERRQPGWRFPGAALSWAGALGLTSRHSWLARLCVWSTTTAGEGRGGELVRSARTPHRPTRSYTPRSSSRPGSRLLGSDLEKVSRSSRFLEKSNQQMDRGLAHSAAHHLDTVLNRAPGRDLGFKSYSLPIAIPSECWGPHSAFGTVPEISANWLHMCSHSLQGPRRRLAPELWPLVAQLLRNPCSPPFELGGLSPLL